MALPWLLMFGACRYAQAQNFSPSFPAVSTANLGLSPAIAAGDFNGDGLSDGIAGGPNTSTYQNQVLNVLLNNGPGMASTVKVTDLPTCGQVNSLVVADLNNDKKLDAVVACTDQQGLSPSIVTLFGNGDGTFQSPASTAMPNIVSLATPVDLNGDGYPDVVASAVAAGKNASPPAYVLLNKGSVSPGSLSLPASVTTSFTFPANSFFESKQIVLADFNGDGKQDIAIGGQAYVAPSQFPAVPIGNDVIVLYGNGDGTFQPAQSTSALYPFVATDVNHDGYADLISISFGTSATQVSTTLNVLLGSASSNFAAGESLPFPATLATGSTATFGLWLINGDGNVTLAFSSSSFDIIRGDSHGNFTFAEAYPFSAYQFAASTTESGSTTIVLSDDFNVSLLNSNSNGTFQGPVTTPVGRSSLAVADFNGDGLTDFVSAESSGYIVTGLARGDGTFATTNRVANPAAASYLVTGDFNNDGKPDVVAINTNPNFFGTSPSDPNATLYFYQGNGDGTFQPSGAAQDLRNYVLVSAIAADFNGDGKLDLVADFDNTSSGSGMNNLSLAFFPGHGDGTFGAPTQIYTTTSLYAGGKILIADLNQDKKPDLIWNNIAFVSNGDGTFNQKPLGVSNAAIFPILAGDLNGDGVPDLVVSSAPYINSIVDVYAGNGDGTFQGNPFYTATFAQACAKTYLFAATIGDVNGDGKADLLLGCPSGPPGSGPSFLAVFLGDGTGNLTADPNVYYAGVDDQGMYQIMVLTRLNSLAPPTSDRYPDLLTFTSTGATVLLNQHNPLPEIHVPSEIGLAVSQMSAAYGQPLTFTATVSGSNPTGSVSFLNASSPNNIASLGSATISAGVATLTVPASPAGTLSVVASYAGDTANLPTSSSPVVITVNGAPAVGLSPLNLSFGSTLVGSTAAAQLVTLTNSGSLPLAVSAIAITGDFAETNTCGTTVQVGAGCTISVTFSPAAAAAETGTLTIADNTSNSPQSVALAGSGAGFSFAASPGLTIASSGGSATATVQLAPLGGFTGTVALTCSIAPSFTGQATDPPTCSLRPSQLQIANGSATASSTLNIGTTAASATLQHAPDFWNRTVSALALVLFIGAFPRRRWREKLILAVCVAFLGANSGCGGSSSGGGGSSSNSGTTTGNYQITVSGKSGTVSVSETIALTLQ